MKKIVCIVSSLLLINVAVNAQKVKFGVKAGVNSSSITGADVKDYDNIMGYHVGGLAHIHITNQIAVQPEVVFSTQGGEDVNEAKLRLNYVNVPVLAQYMFKQGFRLETGPQVGFLASAEKISGGVENDVSGDLKGADFSWVFGAGYIFPMGFGIDARYNLGLSNISSHVGSEAHNRVAQVGVFYQFGNKK